MAYIQKRRHLLSIQWLNKPTSEVLLARVCCQSALGYLSAADCLAYLNIPLSEARFLEVLHEERVLLLVHQVFSGELKPHITEHLKQSVGQEAKKILHRQLVLAQVELEVQKALQAQNITHIFLKGPALNQALWGRRLMRYSGDLDVLIAPEDGRKAHTILQSLGFEAHLSLKKMLFHQRFHRLSTKKDIAYWRERAFLQKVELHWKTYCTEFIVRQSRLEGFADEAYVLYLCLHAAKHGWSRLMWLVDIVAFLNQKQLDVLRLRALAKARHITPVLDEAILLAKAWLNVDLLPEGQLTAIQKREVWLERRVVWARKSGVKDTLGLQLLKRFFMNAFCSNPVRQMLLWAQIFAGTISKSLIR